MSSKDRYYAIAGILGAGSMIQWMGRLLYGSEVSRDDSIAMLTQAARTSSVGSKGCGFCHIWPAKERQIVMKPARLLSPAWAWIIPNQDIARATIEGLAYELAYLWEALEGFTGQPSLRTISVGGGSQNEFWMQIKADVTNRTLYVASEAEAVAKGAAMLAGIGHGLWPDAQTAVEAWQSNSSTIVPDSEDSQRICPTLLYASGHSPYSTCS